MPGLGDSARVRELIPAAQQPAKPPPRREQRRAPAPPRALPTAPPDGTDDHPRIDEYI